MNGTPRFLTWHERLAYEQMMTLPQCPYCHLRTVHRADCPNYEPPPNLGFWSDLQQRRVYRESVRDLGCVCHWRMPPHTHSLDCPMYRTDEDWADHLAEEAAND